METIKALTNVACSGSIIWWTLPKNHAKYDKKFRIVIAITFLQAILFPFEKTRLGWFGWFGLLLNLIMCAYLLMITTRTLQIPVQIPQKYLLQILQIYHILIILFYAGTSLTARYFRKSPEPNLNINVNETLLEPLIVAMTAYIVPKGNVAKRQLLKDIFGIETVASRHLKRQVIQEKVIKPAIIAKFEDKTKNAKTVEANAEHKVSAAQIENLIDAIDAEGYFEIKDIWGQIEDMDEDVFNEKLSQKYHESFVANEMKLVPTT